MKKYIYVFVDSLAIFLFWVMAMIYSVLTVRENFLFLVLGLIAAFEFLPISMNAILLILDIRSGLQKKEVRLSVVADKEGMEIFFKVKYIDLFFENTDMRKSYRLYSGKMPQGIKTGDMLRISYYPRTRIIDELEKL